MPNPEEFWVSRKLGLHVGSVTGTESGVGRIPLVAAYRGLNEAQKTGDDLKVGVPRWKRCSNRASRDEGLN